MSPQEFSTLKRYSMKYASEKDDLVLQAYEEGLRLGEKRSMPLLVNFMKLRGIENNRSLWVPSVEEEVFVMCGITSQHLSTHLSMAMQR